MLGVVVLAVLLVIPFTRSSRPVGARFSERDILTALWLTETSGRADPPDGDGGRAIGPFQIHRRYWVDARLPGRYEDCRDRAYAERVVAAYMRRYVPEAWHQGDAEVIARTHNGGPRGRFKTATDRYWQRMVRFLPPRR